MSGDCVADAGVSRPEREDERGRADARAKPVSGAFGDAERPEADVPPGLWQFARKQLREAYFHAARANARDLELNPRPTHEDDRLAADPPDPEPGVRRVLSAICDLAAAATRVTDDDGARARGESGSGDADAARFRDGPGPRGPGDANDRAGTRDSSPDALRAKRAKWSRAATRVSSLRARFVADVKRAARQARADWRAARTLLLDDAVGAGEASRRAVRAHLERAAESERRAKWRTRTITGRHGDLRRRAGGSRKNVGVDDDDGGDKADDLEDLAASETAWRAATGVLAAAGDAASASAYAEAAEETGRRPWVTEALRWCHDFATRFLRGGGAAAFALKAERRRFFSETNARMTDAEAEARLRALTRGLFGMDGDPGLVPHRRVGAGKESGNDANGDERARTRPAAQLLDVGSCWDYFRSFEDATKTYEVVALDLVPRSPRVFRCDFLELAISHEGCEMETSVAADWSAEEEKRATATATATATLASYPANRASAVVMSLVLSYLPDPRMRGEMVRRARRVLLDQGRGVFLIVTPHSTDRSYSGSSKTDALAVWKDAVERVGFERVAYERKKSVHCLAFRTVGKGPGSVKPGEAPQLPIAFDAKERETRDRRDTWEEVSTGAPVVT